MNISKSIIDIMAILKPVLTKVMPITVLRKAKKAYMLHNTNNLKKEQILSFRKDCGSKGINVIGNIRGDSGLGQSCRLVAKEIEESGIELGVFEHHVSDLLSMTDKSCDYLLERELQYNVNLFHINAHEFTISYMQLGKSVWDYHYNIAFWLWELEKFPTEWIGCLDIVDEVWTPSEFVSASIREVTSKPVITIPYHVEAPVSSKYDREYFKLPNDKFLFLMMYDSSSMMERKNPLGVLAAFKKAFPMEREDVGLVIKMNGEKQEDLSAILQCLDGYTNIYIMTDVLSKVEVNSLVAEVDVFVSMHRAEGFGLVLAEAMLNGTPCIATNWSANTEFMNAEVACMLDYELVPLKKDVGPFKKGNYWAEPDVNQASEYMRKLVNDQYYYQNIQLKAKEHVHVKLGKENISSLIKKRFCEINAL